MPRIYKPGDHVGNYTIDREINRGMTAFSYEAHDRRGRAVFLKQYRSPTVRVEWYEDYVAYQKVLRDRLESGACRNFCYRFLDAFEFDRCFYQAFEFLDRSNSMEELHERIAEGARQITGEQRLIMAKVLVGGVNALHQSGIVHSDLKPANVMLIRDKSIVAGYRVKIIDMDFSLMTDRRAPWHGERGYFGTPGYLSPEHLRGEVPTIASDVFTLGLMLCELLTQGHPYRFDTEEQYREAVLAHRAKAPRLSGQVARRVDVEEVGMLIWRCLSPDPLDRPKPTELSLALNNRSPRPEAMVATSADKPLLMVDFEADSPVLDAEVVEPEEPTPTGLPITGRLTLRNGSRELSFNVTTRVGRHLLRQFGPDSRFADEAQFRLERDEDGWRLVPMPETSNDTMHNGRRVTQPVHLSEGDTVSLGRESKGIVKLPLDVSGEREA